MIAHERIDGWDGSQGRTDREKREELTVVLDGHVLDVHTSVGLVPSPAGRGRPSTGSGRVRAWTCTASASARGGPLGVHDATPKRSARFDTARIGPCRTLGRALIRPPALDIGQTATFSQREKDDCSRAHRGGHDSAGSDGSRVPGGSLSWFSGRRLGWS